MKRIKGHENDRERERKGLINFVLIYRKDSENLPVKLTKLLSVATFEQSVCGFGLTLQRRPLCPSFCNTWPVWWRR